jgi:hypothetical protein
MASSFIDPSLVALAVEPAAPPWNWNPGATFVAAFNDAQANRRAEEKQALDIELNNILLPYKRAQAALELDKLQQDVERSTLLTERYRQASKQTHSGIMDGIRNPQAADQVNINPYDIFNGGGATTPSQESTGEAEPQDDGGGMDIMGYSSAAAGSTDANPIVSLASSLPDVESRPQIDTSKIPATGLLADSSGELTPTAISAMKVASDAVAPRDAGSVADDMLLSRLRGSTSEVDFNSLPSPEEVSKPRVSIDDAPGVKSEPKAASSGFGWDSLDPLLAKRKLLKAQYDGIQGIKNYRLDPVKLDQTTKWNQATASALEKLSAFGITDPVTLDALTDLPSERRLKAQQIVQENMANGGTPNWTSAIEQVNGGSTSEGGGGDRRTELAKMIREIGETDFPDRDAVLNPLVAEFQSLSQQQPAFEQFASVQAQLDLLPAYQKQNRPLNGRQDYDILSQELQDTKLQAVAGMIERSDPRVLNFNSYARTKDGTQLTKSGMEQYQKDLTEKRAKFGNKFVIFTGTDAVFPKQGEVETSRPQVTSNVATPYDEAVKSEESASKSSRIRQIEQEIAKLDEYVADIPDRGLIPFTEGSSWGVTKGGADSISLPYLGKRTAKQKQDIAKDRLNRRQKLLEELSSLRSGG